MRLKKEPFPIRVNCGILFPIIVLPPVKKLVTERAIMPTARVTMNGGREILVMIIPFRNPYPVEIVQQMSMISASGRSGVPSGFTILCRRMRTAPELARTEPEERSIPPLMITNVIPSEMIPTMEELRRIVDIFSGLRNLGAAIPQATMIMANTTMTLFFLQICTSSVGKGLFCFFSSTIILNIITSLCFLCQIFFYPIDVTGSR
jgi:hypothetical protein